MIRHVAVIDIGKTNAKLATVDLRSLSETAVRKTANRPRSGPPYRHHDVEALWTFILESLQALRREHPIDAISVATHGATAALLDADGGPALPVLDYEDSGPEASRARYNAARPPFRETGSPALPLGLNLGAQLFWQAETFPEAFGRVEKILTYPQYWSWRLTGIAASEATSLGCHTDLWDPARRDFSTLVEHMGWRGLFPPVRPADALLGTIRPAVAARTGLDQTTPVFCGIHDSNASLLPHLLARRAPFSVVSTGTWVVSMAVGGRAVDLDPARDTLVNVDALGNPVPSARFMGGREFELLTEGAAMPPAGDAAEQAVLERGVMLLPSVQQGSGPFPSAQSRWIGEPSGPERAVAVSFYLALMTATCLDLIGADGDTVVEGPFALNDRYCRMLRATTGRPVLPQAGQATGTGIGAALLAGGKQALPGTDAAGNESAHAAMPADWRRYAALWRAAVRNGRP